MDLPRRNRPMLALVTVIALTTALLTAAVSGTSARTASDQVARAAAPDCVQPTGVQSASANVEEDVNPARQAIDGDLATRWSGHGFGAALVLDLGTSRAVCGVQVAWHRGDLRWTDHTIYTSVDGVTYTKTWAGRSSGTTSGSEPYLFADAVQARYVKVAVWGNAENEWASISETRPLTPAEPGSSTTVVAVGDVANSCAGSSDCPQAATADLVRSIDPQVVLGVGDLANGGYQSFQDYFDPSWGSLKARIKPTPGNHEYDDPGAGGYFSYFGAAAAPEGTSWYSFDLGDWHVVSLNSESERRADSPQLQWLRADLAANTRPCVLAFWHRPKYSSGSTHGDFPNMRPFWDELHAAGADLVLNGHDHHYERFGPQSPSGSSDPQGIRQFVIGTGGSGLRPLGTVRANSETRVTGEHGVLQLELASGSYSWRFRGLDDDRDQSGPVACH